MASSVEGSEHMTLDVFSFYTSGYQVCEKWLKDRRGRALTYGVVEHYCK